MLFYREDCEEIVSVIESPCDGDAPRVEGLRIGARQDLRFDEPRSGRYTVLTRNGPARGNWIREERMDKNEATYLSVLYIHWHVYANLWLHRAVGTAEVALQAKFRGRFPDISPATRAIRNNRELCLAGAVPWGFITVEENGERREQ